MIINRNINLQDLALEALNQCPKNLSKKFEDGFNDFSKNYFDETEFYAEILTIDGLADVDLSMPLKTTINDLMKSSVSEEYLKGVSEAIIVCNDLLSFVFEEVPKHRAA